ncbi:MAG TPA: apolipoprotein N-acyltransferase [Burkholderiales bacterium]|nr:apolipoprotein N-acyltransferase [Burkholderiales bacterium]
MTAFLAGAAAVPAFAPIGFFPIALLAFAWLAHLWANASPRRAFWTGFAFGMGLFGAGVSWVYVSLSQFGGMPPPLAALATFLFCALLAAFTGGAGWLQARVPASEPVRAALLIPASWTLFEWLRSWVFTGFPWLAAGYATTGWPLQGFAPLLGVFGASFLVVSLAGMLCWFARRRRALALAPIALALLAGQALRAVDWTSPLGEPVGVALLQGNVGQEMKFRPEQYARTLETYARLAEETSRRLVVLPETALPQFLDRIDPAYLARLEAAARRNNGDLLVGVPYRTVGGNYYNSVISLGTSPRQIYHKTHLVPFGEFVPPLFGWVMNWLKIYLGDFARGAPDQPPLAAAGQQVAVNICYEDAFGDDIGPRAARATLLANLSNVAWFGDSLAPSQHLQIARLRAIETGRVHLAATNTGITAAIDRDGTVLARLPQFAEGRLEIEVQGYTGVTPYMRFSDWPIVALCLGLLSAATLVAWRRQRR